MAPEGESTSTGAGVQGFFSSFEFEQVTSVSAAPALPLLAMGLVVLGFFGRRIRVR